MANLPIRSVGEILLGVVRDHSSPTGYRHVTRGECVPKEIIHLYKPKEEQMAKAGKGKK
jgi:type VI protein secretion system component Hcp